MRFGQQLAKIDVEFNVKNRIERQGCIVRNRKIQELSHPNPSLTFTTRFSERNTVFLALYHLIQKHSA